MRPISLDWATKSVVAKADSIRPRFSSSGRQSSRRDLGLDDRRWEIHPPALSGSAPATAVGTVGGGTSPPAKRSGTTGTSPYPTPEMACTTAGSEGAPGDGHGARGDQHVIPATLYVPTVPRADGT